MPYFRAIDPFPLETAEQTTLHAFYTHLGEGRLTTTSCLGCGRTAWPPRGFCPECGSDRYEWTELPADGVVHAFTVQETGVPQGFESPRVFAIVKVGGHRLFTVLVGVDHAALRVGQQVRLSPLRVTDDSKGSPRWLPGFTASPEP